MFVERLKNEYGVNEPIFTDEILKTFSDYSRPRVFQLIKKAEQANELVRFDKGVYYIPTQTRFGNSVISVEQVVEKKYIENNGKVFGIYGGLNLQVGFLLTYQMSNAIEIITNKETMWVREKKVDCRTVILRKSRCEITKDNATTYMIFELFNTMNMERYKKDSSVRREIIEFAKEEGITTSKIFALASAFPSQATKNIIESGFINEIA